MKSFVTVILTVGILVMSAGSPARADHNEVPWQIVVPMGVAIAAAEGLALVSTVVNGVSEARSERSSVGWLTAGNTTGALNLAFGIGFLESRTSESIERNVGIALLATGLAGLTMTLWTNTRPDKTGVRLALVPTLGVDRNVGTWGGVGLQLSGF